MIEHVDDNKDGGDWCDNEDVDDDGFEKIENEVEDDSYDDKGDDGGDDGGGCW